MDKKAEILRCGRALFCANGFKNTSVSDITKMAGIAAGTFYLYYPSKDLLFMEIFNEENVKLKNEILAAIDLNGDPQIILPQLVHLNLKGMSTNPILKEWYNKEVFQKIEETFRASQGLERVDFLYFSFLDLVKKWQAAGQMRADIDSEMIMAIFAAIIQVDTHKEEIGLQYFPELLTHLTDFVLKGLAAGPHNTGSL